MGLVKNLSFRIEDEPENGDIWLRRPFSQQNSPREAVTDLIYELKIFAFLMFLIKISPFSFKAVFESPM